MHWIEEAIKNRDNEQSEGGVREVRRRPQGHLLLLGDAQGRVEEVVARGLLFIQVSRCFFLLF